MRVWVFAALAAAVFAWAPQAQAADIGYLKIVGAKQGAIAGGTGATSVGGVEVLSFDYGVSAPTGAGGMATGRPVEGPATFTLPWSTAMAKLYTAALTNENLSTVEFVDDSTASGQQGLRFSLKLTNAHIAALKILDSNGKDPGIDPVVVVTLTFQKITLTDGGSGVTTADDWTAAQ